MTTLGRGGSDTTAVALSAALGADACEIYTDVRGVFTADPRLVPTARKLDRVSFEEMLEMASSGAGVMMARSIEIARTHNVRLNVRSSFEDDGGNLDHGGGRPDARESTHLGCGASTRRDRLPRARRAAGRAVRRTRDRRT